MFIVSFFLVVFFSCEKEALVREDPSMALKEYAMEMQMVPFRGLFTQTICTDQVIECSIEGVFFPKFICLDGNVSHLGRVRDGMVTVLTCGPAEEPGSLTGETRGYLVASNGDTLRFYGTSTVFADGTGKGHQIISGGSGRFEFACGQYDVFSYNSEDGINYGSVSGELCNLGHFRK